LTTSTFSTVGAIGFGVTAMAYNPADSKLYALRANQFGGAQDLIIIDQLTGAGASLGTVAGGSWPDMTFTGGVLYAWSENGDHLVTINIVTRAVTNIAISISSAGSGLAADSTGTLYFTPLGSNLYRLNPSVPSSTLITSLSSSEQINGATFFNGQRYGKRKGTNTLVRIDKATGAVTTLFGLPPRIDALASSAP
jgi:hypothetical protein